MKKTGKQIEEKGLNATSGGNLYRVDNTFLGVNTSSSLYDSHGNLIKTFYTNKDQKIDDASINATAEQKGKYGGTRYNATEEQMKELRETGRTTINGVEFHSGD